MKRYGPVLTKRDFVRRYEVGEFGNASPTWRGLNTMENSGVLEGKPDGTLFHIRNRVKGGPTWYDIRVEDLADKWHEVIEGGVAADSLYISEMAPTEKTILQGEIFYNEQGITLHYSKERLTMRDALKKNCQNASGIIALRLLDYYLNPVSMDWMEVLINRYPGHVIEFSTYSTCWGTLPGYNTVVWEVRQY